MESIYFEIKQQHNFRNGEAEIVSSYSEGKKAAQTFFDDSGDEREMRTNLVGGYEGYKIYENYTDSGSVDYVYFAIKI